ncbi:MAG: hypothetical protein E6I08_13920 [Chloroflexi bacterium]|nr:MAG: hypothetical protein E6I08_13920 [Chloroflexota bacterium]
MGNRAILVLGVVAVAVLGAVWYAAGGPARSTSETVPAELALSAVQTGSGSWVRYVVTIKNAGDVDFSGEVVLLNRADPLLGSGGQPTPPPAVTQPKVPNQIPRLPAEAPDAGYEIHVVVPARQVLTRVITAPDRYTQVAAAQDPEGSLVGEPVTVDRSLYVPVAVFSTSSVPIDQVQSVRFDDWLLRVTEYQDLKSFPTTAAGLAGYVAVIIDQYPTLQLSEAQRTALRDFVGQGGSLVVAGGSDWRRTLLGLPPELSQLHATGTDVSSLAAVSALAGRNDDLQAPIVTGDLQPGARAVLSDPSGRPLLLEGHYGGGLISALTFDPAAAPVAGSQLAVPAWIEALGRTLDHSPGAMPTTRTLPGVDATVAQALPTLRGAALPSPWLVGPLLLLYLLLVAPVNYLFLRRRMGRPDLFWLTAPALAAVFTGAFYWVGTDIQGGIQDEELQVLHLAPNGAAAEVDYHQVVFRSRGDHELEMVKPGLAAPLTFDLSDSSVALSGLPQAQEHVVPIQRAVVLEKGVVYGSVRILGTATAGRSPVGVEAHLAYQGGHVVGRILNTGKQPVHGIALYTISGGSLQRTALASLIPPGGAANVDSTPANLEGNPNAPVFGTNAPPDAMTRIARAVGITAVSQGTHPFLVGFTDPLPGALDVDGSVPSRSATAVWQLPVSMEAADSDLGRFTAIHLAGVSGQRPAGFSDIYDIELPAQSPSRLQVGFDKFQYSKVEVWDWSAQAWAGGSWQDDPNNPGRLVQALAPTQVAAGLLRLRVKEVRLTWGSGLFVAPGS